MRIKSQRGFIPIIILVIVLLLGGAAIYYFVNKTNINFQEKPIVSASPVAVITPSPTLYPTETLKGSKVFESKNLGIRFSYAEKIDNYSVKTLEKGNRVYVYQVNNYTKPEDGQYVEVFAKDENDSIETSIRKEFLKGISVNDCKVESMKLSFTPSGCEAFQITYPIPKNDTEDKPYWSYGEKCPQNYRQTNGLRYFLGCKNQPTKLLFFSIGQYVIQAGIDSGATWQDTIQLF